MQWMFFRMFAVCGPCIKHFIILTFPYQPHHHSGFYDRKKLFWKEIEDLTVVAACGPPGGGRQEVTPRLLRHFTMLCMPAPSEAAMRHIFGGILGGFLTTFFPPGEERCTWSGVKQKKVEIENPMREPD